MSSVQRVELQPGVAIPLPTKRGSVIIRGNKPWDATPDRELSRALRTPQCALRRLIWWTKAERSARTSMHAFGQRPAGLVARAPDLVVNPTVGFFQAVPQPDAWRPAQTLFDERVVAVATVHALGRFQVIIALQLHAGDPLDEIHQLIDGDQFVAAQVERFDNLALEDGLRSFQAVVDVHEAAGLMTITPDLDLMFAGELRLDDFAANGRGRLFASAHPGAIRAIDVMEPGHAGFDAKVFPEMATHPFAEQFLPAVAVFGHRGIRVGFLEGGDVRVALLVGIIDAGGGGVEITLDAKLLRGHEQVGVDQHRQHAEAAIVLDEP